MSLFDTGFAIALTGPGAPLSIPPGKPQPVAMRFVGATVEYDPQAIQAPDGSVVAGVVVTPEVGPDAAMRIHAVEATIDVGDLSGLGAGITSYLESLSAAVPAEARFAGVMLEEVTNFDDGLGGTIKVNLGTFADMNYNSVIDGVIVSVFDPLVNPATAGVFFGKRLGAGTFRLKLYNDSGNDLNVTVAGSVKCVLFYFIV